jgi:hypothetical protein
MRNLICWCPQTQRPIDLQLFTDYVTLARIWSSSVHFYCPHCGADHETKVSAACLQTTLLEPQRARHQNLKRKLKSTYDAQSGRLVLGQNCNRRIQTLDPRPWAAPQQCPAKSYSSVYGSE